MSPVERPTTVAQLSGGRVEYRFEPRGNDTILVFHGGHMRAGLPVGEHVFEDLGYSVLSPSRPGYGKTPVLPDSSPEGFALTTSELCAHLGIERLAAVMGMSAGGRSGLAIAANHPNLVPRLILVDAVGFQPWPDRRMRVAADVLFNPVCEKAFWGLVHAIMRRAPKAGLRAMIRSLSTEPPEEVVAGLSDEERTRLAGVFARMRSGRGFWTDLKYTRQPSTARILQPTLIIASRGDGVVPLTQAESTRNSIEQAELMVAESKMHFMGFGAGSAEISDRIRAFLSHAP
jgi:pimeloyl-ACP methyl ester carboxylesterase